MVLQGVKKQDGWLLSEWRLTYRVGWSHICAAAQRIWEYTKDPEILISDAGGQEAVSVAEAEAVRRIREAGTLTVRGMSKILDVPVSITFFNQLDLVRATVACATEEFREADYQKFNKSMGQFMDSAELAMYAK